MNITEIINGILIDNAFIMSFMFIAGGVLLSSVISKYIFKGRLPASAVAIVIGLIAAYIGGRITGGSHGISDIDVFTGIGVLGGSSLRDFAIISTETLRTCRHVFSHSRSYLCLCTGNNFCRHVRIH